MNALNGAMKGDRLMKKSTTAKRGCKGLPKGKQTHLRQLAANQHLTVALDLGDRTSRYCVLDEAGQVVSEDQLPTTRAGLDSLFRKMPPSRVALEVGTHSPWVSRHIAGMGHEVIVANPHKVKLITQSLKKNDRMDAEQLARLARVDPKLLSPIRHRGEEAQADLAVIRARAELVDTRTKLINCARGLAKPMGERLKPCDADQVKESLADVLGAALQKVIRPLLKSVEEISKQISVYDQEIEQIGQRYPEKKVLTQVWGVGTLIAMTYILTIEDPERFEHSRDVGPYLGLTRKQRDSGESQPELGISKAGDQLMRRLLVQGAQCILRQGAPDSDLKAWGMARLPNGSKKDGQKGSKKGSKATKRKAVVAIARKLAVLLHRLWVTGEVYDPQYNRKAAQAGKVAA
jgi:transposase